MQHLEQVVNEIFSLYEEHGSKAHEGEDISRLEHMSQCAHFAIAEGFDEEIVLASFFHDIGHICKINDADKISECGAHHAKAGADFLREKGFPERIAQLVENHVQAKRYLTYKYPEYYEELSEASRASLISQGRIMSEEEAERYELDPLFMLSLIMRKWDEKANEKGMPIIDLSILKQVTLEILIRDNKAAQAKATHFFNSI